MESNVDWIPLQLLLLAYLFFYLENIYYVNNISKHLYRLWLEWPIGTFVSSYGFALTNSPSGAYPKEDDDGDGDDGDGDQDNEHTFLWDYFVICTELGYNKKNGTKHRKAIAHNFWKDQQKFRIETWKTSLFEQ